MFWLPGFEFSGDVFVSGVTQFRHEFGVLRGEPVLKLIERFHGRKHLHGNFNGVRCHGVNLANGRAKASAADDARAAPFNERGTGGVGRDAVLKTQRAKLICDAAIGADEFRHN